MNAKECDKMAELKQHNRVDDVQGSLLTWFARSATKLDNVSLVGIFTILVFYNSRLNLVAQSYLNPLSDTHYFLSPCFIKFYIFHSILAFFALLNGISVFIQIKELKKSSLRELFEYFNAPVLEQNLFSANKVFARKRKISLYFVVLVILLLMPIIFYDWYQFIQQCDSEKNLPLDLMGMVFYSALFIRAPIYLIGFLNFKFGD